MIDAYLKRHAALLDEIRAFNDDQFRRHVDTPPGVGWNSTEAQLVRFDQLLKLIPDAGTSELGLNDIGCGYGALFDYLMRSDRRVDYRGYELSSASLATARAQRRDRPDEAARFRPLERLTPAEYSLASGLFAMRFHHSDDDWRQYVIDTLNVIRANSTRGFAFNMLTSYSDQERMEDELYYADPCTIFDLCKRHYSRNVALLHDYSLYDFTILVRLD